MTDPVISLIKSDRIAYQRAEDSCDGVAEGNPPPAAVAEYNPAMAASDESADRLPGPFRQHRRAPTPTLKISSGAFGAGTSKTPCGWRSRGTAWLSVAPSNARRPK